jgi:hypothetical protein
MAEGHRQWAAKRASPYLDRSTPVIRVPFDCAQGSGHRQERLQVEAQRTRAARLYRDRRDRATSRVMGNENLITD